MSPTLRKSPESLLARALELLAEVPTSALDPKSRKRLRDLLDDARAERDRSETPTVSEREHLFPLHVTAAERALLERALPSPHVGPGCNYTVRDFVLVAARDGSYEPLPDLRQVVVPHGLRSTVLAYSFDELKEVLAHAQRIGCPADRFMRACALARLTELHARWPDDLELAAAAPPQPIPIHYFKKTP